MRLALFLFAWGAPLCAGDCLTPQHRIVQLRVVGCEAATDAALTRFLGSPATAPKLLGGPLAQGVVVTARLERQRLPQGPWKGSSDAPALLYLYRGANGCAAFPEGRAVRMGNPTECRCREKSAELCSAGDRLLYDVEPQWRKASER